jgi:hypothetical protein
MLVNIERSMRGFPDIRSWPFHRPAPMVMDLSGTIFLGRLPSEHADEREWRMRREHRLDAPSRGVEAMKEKACVLLMISEIRMALQETGQSGV